MHYLAKSGYPKCLEILTRMGAIPFCIDEKGDNVLHVLISGYRMNTIYDLDIAWDFFPSA